jgi:hypothetical protein
MIYLALFVGLFGLWATSWGVWASFNRRPPIDVLGAVMAPLGVVLTLLAGILLFVPDFLF